MHAKQTRRKPSSNGHKPEDATQDVLALRLMVNELRFQLEQARAALNSARQEAAELRQQQTRGECTMCKKWEAESARLRALLHETRRDREAAREDLRILTAVHAKCHEARRQAPPKPELCPMCEIYKRQADTWQSLARLVAQTQPQGDTLRHEELRRLIRVAHPDRWENHPVATALTQELTALLPRPSNGHAAVGL